MDFPEQVDSSEVLSELLASSFGDSTPGQAAVAVRKDDYSKLVAFGNLTSFSMQQTLHACPRKFQLLKLAAASEHPIPRESNVTFAFGHAVGAGVAEYDATKDLNRAIFAAFLAWDIDLFAEQETKANRTPPKKSFHHAVWALKVYEVFCQDETDFHDYDVVKLEATIAVDFENGHFYVGHVDELLRNKETGQYRIKENKTTVFSAVDPALYSNSDQALSYALVIDSVGATEYAVTYCIYSSSEQRWILMEFTKSALQKVEWLQDQAMMHSTLDMYSEANLFPKRGRSCLEFNRRCEHFETCDFNSERVYGKRYSQLETIENLEELEAIKPIDFKFRWSEILSTQKEKLA